MKILRDIWIILDTGIVLYSRVFDEKVNEQLFGALMSALNSYAKDIGEGDLSDFQMGNYKFYIHQKENCIFIASANPNASEKKALAELNSISDKFFTKFSNSLKNWDSDITRFSSFSKDIEDSLEEAVKQFKEAFW